MRRRSRCAGPGLQRDRRGGRACNCQRVADLRLPGREVGGNLLIHAEGLVFRLPRPCVLVLWQHHELGDQPGPSQRWRQLHELHTPDRSAERLCPRLLQGVRHGYVSDLEPGMHYLHDQGADLDTGTRQVADAEANPTSFTIAVAFWFAITKSIGDTWRERWNAFAHSIARFPAARRRRRQRS